MGWDVPLGGVVSDPSKGPDNVGGLVDVGFQGAAQGSVEPGAHGTAVCHIVNGRLHSLTDCA